ncbi:uncharacterized protein LOC132750383 [Ruditapes philippinarum]|uniref:uncharacterized protein LOC132750383 n=1 Tax=Ruditapes philippinarum TaxID=129788 RepID=UPI00295B63F6|nr:uncharacterized protein LOC132750383 [Ruditapes philippinarum]
MCYSCEETLDPKSCRHLVTCQKGFGCMLQAVGHNADLQTVYKSSCEPDWLCNRMPHSSDELIGKRAGTPEVAKRSSTCNKCCHQHLCNGHCDKSTQHVSQHHTTPTPIPTTHKTTTHTRPTTTNTFSATPLHVKTHAPTFAHAQPTVHYKHENCIKHNFTSIPYINLCFKLETVSLSWTVAERWCGFYGATLAVLDEPGKFSVVETVLRYEPHFRNEVVYTGGHDQYGNGTFYWPHQRLLSLGSWSGLNFQRSTGKCIALDGTNGFRMAFVDCDKYRKFICSIDTS